MNIFEFNKFKVMIDYAHNPSSLEAIGKFVSTLGDIHSISIIAGTGDRRDEDLKNYGWIAAEYFDEVIVWEDKDYARGRDSKEVMDVVVQGTQDNPRKAQVRVIRDEDDAVDYALENAHPDSIICIFTGRVTDITAKMKSLKEDELQLKITKQDIPNINLADGLLEMDITSS
jgi:cyanophycin synthetase